MQAHYSDPIPNESVVTYYGHEVSDYAFPENAIASPELLDHMAMFDNDLMDEDVMFQWFQRLTDNGVVWLMPKRFQVMAEHLIDIGMISGVPHFI